MGLYNLCSENKDADQLHVYSTADLRLCFRIYAKSRFYHDAAHLKQTTFDSHKIGYRHGNKPGK